MPLFDFNKTLSQSTDAIKSLSALNPLTIRKKGTRAKAVFALTLVCILWGTTWLASKQGVQYIPDAIQMAGIRQLLGGLCYVGFFLYKKMPLPKGKEWIPIIVLSFLNFKIIRADRQPEFTQLDVEMSFVDQEDVLEVGEAVVRALWGGVLGYEVGDIPRITYADSMARYGNDKPDLRFGLELTDLTGYFAQTEFRVFQAPYVGAVVMPGGASQARRTFDAWQEFAKQRGARGLAYVTFLEDGTLGGPVAKNLSDAERDGLREAVGASVGDCVFFGAGETRASQGLLAAVRLEIGARAGLIDESEWKFVWVVDAPMFEPTEEGGWTAVHHPFTSPNADWASSFVESPGEALAYAYDIVCNGNEIGGGSVRIHRSEMQKQVFEVIGVSEEDAADKFGFLLEAFQYGPPPHAGIAFGWDRICMLLAGASSLREVIAFPKTGGGGDPLTGAPTPITAEQRAEAGVDWVPEP